jgi:hypothetical protein
VMIGEPSRRRPTFVSNTVAFALVARVDTAAKAGTKLTITGDRLLHPDVECVTLVGNQTVTDYDVGSTSSQLTMTLPPELEPGIPVRVFVRVNGVQSIDQVTVTP